MRRLVPIATFVIGALLASGIVVATAGTTTPAEVKVCVTPSGVLRIQKPHGCPKHTKALALSVTGPQGLTGPEGPTGPIGVTGPTGTPDPSLFYTKTDADARFAKKSTVLEVPGQAFHPVVSSALVNRADFLGMYETGTRQYALAELTAIPPGSTITSVDFLMVHASGAQTEIDIVDGSLATGTSDAVVFNHYTTTAPGIQTVTLTPPGGYTPRPGHAPTLLWNPANQSTDDIIWGARVHYTAP
jgi:hypothetical protein